MCLASVLTPRQGDGWTCWRNPDGDRGCVLASPCAQLRVAGSGSPPEWVNRPVQGQRDPTCLGSRSICVASEHLLFIRDVPQPGFSPALWTCTLSVKWAPNRRKRKHSLNLRLPSERHKGDETKDCWAAGSVGRGTRSLLVGAAGSPWASHWPSWSSKSSQQHMGNLSPSGAGDSGVSPPGTRCWGSRCD